MTLNLMPKEIPMLPENPALHTLWKRGTDFLGTRYALLAGAMTWVSDRHLVSAMSNAGAFGIIACGSMTPDLLRTEIQETQKLTSKPFGVNLITLHPQVNALAQVCIDAGVTHVFLAGGLPNATTIKLLKDAGVKVICFAPALVLAKKLIRQGVDALVIEGMEAGGHIGPVSTGVLAQEILPHVTDVPVFVAGGIGRGETIVTYLEMGAAGCQMGTLFVCAEECRAHDNFKHAFIRANARDALASTQIDPRFPVIPVRAITNKASEDFMRTQVDVIKKFNDGLCTQEEAQLEIEHYWAGALRRAAVDGDVERGSLMAGQSVGMVKEIRPLTHILQDLLTQAHTFLERKAG